MHLSSSTVWLLVVPSLVSAIAVPKPANRRNEDPMNHTNILATPESTSTNLPSAEQHGRSYMNSPVHLQSQDFARHAQDRHERLVAECEAGFVTGCEASIKEAKSTEGSISKSPIQSKVFHASPELPLAPMSPLSNSEEQTHDYLRNNIPPFGFFAVSIPVVFVVTILRVAMRSGSKCDQIVRI
jgi:hypothetical protein